MRERIEGRNRIHSAVVSRKGPQPPSDLRRTGTPCRLPQWHSPYPGASGQAQTVIDESARRFPSDTLLNNVSLPTASAAIEIGRGDPAKAIELLRPASPYELGRFADFAPIYCSGLGVPPRAGRRTGRRRVPKNPRQTVGDVTKAIDAYNLWKQTYPRDWIPPHNQAFLYVETGEYQKAIEGELRS